MAWVLLFFGLSGAQLHPKHFLWKVSDQNSQVWVLGSIHMGSDSLYPLAPWIEKAFSGSTGLAVELNMDNDSTLSEVAKLMATEGVYAKGDSLQAHISPLLFARLDSLFREWNLPTRGMTPMRPWFLTLRINSIDLEQSGISAGLGVDMHFLQQAKKRNMPVFALETVRQQIDIFKDLPDSLQETMLEWTLREQGKLDGIVDSMFAFWNTGDTLGFEKLVLSDMQNDAKFSPFYQRIYSDRNVRMASQVEQFLQKKRKMFVVVGAAHLVGPGSVLGLLRKKGFQVEQF